MAKKPEVEKEVGKVAKLARRQHAEPVRLIGDETTGDRLLLYATERGIQVELHYEGETFWMTQAQIAELFGRDVSVISRHIANVVAEGELPEEGNLQKMQIAGSTRPVTVYSLDMVISVGYRVSVARSDYVPPMGNR